MYIYGLITHQKCQAMVKKLLFSAMMVLYGMSISAQNDVGIGTSSPAAKLDVRGNGINYDVLNVTNDKLGPIDSVFVITQLGHVGIGTSSPGTYMLKVLNPLFPAGGGSSAFVSQIEVWDNDPANSASRMLGDINNFAGQEGIFNLYNAGTKSVQFRANGTSYINGGPVGLGVSAPLEKLHLDPLNGAIVLGSYVQPVGSEVTGTIEWNGANFRGFDGTQWLNLDAQNNGWQILNPGPYGTPALYTATGSFTAVSLVGGNPGAAFPPSQFGYLYVNNTNAPSIYGHLLLLHDMFGNSDASQAFMISNWQNSGINQQYSLGIFNADASFKLMKAGALGATAQGDGTTMIRANTNGIIDHPNQSRVRAYHVDPNGIAQQLIIPNTWIPINFNIDSPLTYGYDQQNEFMTATAVNQLVPPENAFFIASVTGYYQVNARCEFNVNMYEPDDNYPTWPGGPVQVSQNSYVAIAIYSGAVVGATTPYAIGNHLQIGYLYANSAGQDVTGKLENNNAPNVSDVIFCQAGQVISIWVYHTALTPMNLIQGKARVYVSIHKVS
jgi:hypothetical protein